MPETLLPTLNPHHLPPSTAWVREALTWQQYQQVLAQLGDRRSSRLTYVHGLLEIRMPSRLHEILNRLLSKIIFTLAEEAGYDPEDWGSTTWNDPALDQGVEPDSCFYIANADRVRKTSDWKIPPDIPPDLVIEVDISSSSRRRLPIYAAMGVPEIWLYEQGRFQILALTGQNYEIEEYSLAFPSLKPEQVMIWIEQRQSQGDGAVIRSVRQFCRGERVSGSEV